MAPVSLGSTLEALFKNEGPVRPIKDKACWGVLAMEVCVKQPANSHGSVMVLFSLQCYMLVRNHRHAHARTHTAEKSQ